jgi:hypothetical protein
VKVDDRQRIRLPLAVVELVASLKPREGEPLECIGVIGQVGIQVIPAAAFVAERRAFDAAIARDPPAATSASVIEAARLLASAWRMQVAIESRQVRINLPEEPRRAGYLPSSGEAAVVFGFGTVLEICSSTAWLTHVGSLARRRTEIISDAMDQLPPE